MCGKLHAPGRPVGGLEKDRLAHPPRLGERHAGLLEGRIPGELGRGALRRIVAPGLDEGAGDHENVVARLDRQPVAGEKTTQAIFAGVVGRRRQAEIAEAVPEIAEIAGRGIQRLNDIKAVLQAPETRRAGHELCDALGPLGADGVRPEQAFAPDQPGKESRRNIARGGEMVDDGAEIGIEPFLANAERMVAVVTLVKTGVAVVLVGTGCCRQREDGEERHGRRS